MKKLKVTAILSYILSGLSLAIGTLFHSWRMHPEDIQKYSIGCTVGIVSVILFNIFLVIGIVLTILWKKKYKV